MKHAWHYWLLYLVSLAATAAGLAWLSRQAMILDRAEAMARQQADLEDDIGRVLWRMDVRMMPLIAKEASRPYFLYEPFYLPPAEDGKRPAKNATVASPMLNNRSELVVLNFQLNSNNDLTSPQLPARGDWERAVAAGARLEDLERNASLVAELQKEVGYDALVASLPEESVQNALTPAQSSVASNSESPPFVANALKSAPNGEAEPPGQQQVPFEADRLQRSQSRNSADLANRNSQFQWLAQQQYLEQRAEPSVSNSPGVVEGISRPMWFGNRLLLARRVTVAGRPMIQGCWLDWPQIKRVLLNEAADLLPSADLQPVVGGEPSSVQRLLATIPAQLVVKPGETVLAEWTPMRTALLLAWVGLGSAAVAAAILLHGVLALSERRAAFVSAVTHELRTPLTTFRLYSEMLSQDMLPDPQQRRQYLDTLRVEADRLGHLVENVLSYARLERGRRGQHRERIAVQQIVDRVQSRFSERAAQAAMEFEVQVEDQAREQVLHTDPGAVEQILFNLVDNACKYAARADDRRIHLRVSANGTCVRWTVADHGPGLAADMAGRLFRPFCKSAQDAANSAPGVGLGLALSLRLARELGGSLESDQESNRGASFRLSLPIAPA